MLSAWSDMGSADRLTCAPVTDTTSGRPSAVYVTGATIPVGALAALSDTIGGSIPARDVPIAVALGARAGLAATAAGNRAIKLAAATASARPAVSRDLRTGGFSNRRPIERRLVCQHFTRSSAALGRPRVPASGWTSSDAA